jgi:hypothetical protein
MNLHIYMQGIIAIAVSALLLLYARSRPKEKNHSVRLEHSLPLKAIAIFAALMPFIVAFDRSRTASPATATFLACVFALMGVPLFLVAFFWRLEYGDQGIRYASPFRRTKFIPYDRIRIISFSSLMKQWVIRTDGVGDIRMNALVPGAQQFIRDLLRRQVAIDSTAQRELASSN